MGTRRIYAICKDCEERKCKECYQGFDSYMFGIIFEWMSKEELIKHIKNQACPCCGSHNWFLTDASDI